MSGLRRMKDRHSPGASPPPACRPAAPSVSLATPAAGPCSIPLPLLALILYLPRFSPQTTRAYRGLWGGLFRQQAGSSTGGNGRPSATDRFRQALADLQSLLHPIDASPSSSTSGQAASSSPRHLPSLEELAAHVGNLTASLLESAHAGSGGTSALLQRLARDFNHSAPTGSSSPLDAAQLAATVASLQAWALAGLVARSGGSGMSGDASTASLGSSLDPSSFKQVAGGCCLAWALGSKLLAASGCAPRVHDLQQPRARQACQSLRSTLPCPPAICRPCLGFVQATHLHAPAELCQRRGLQCSSARCGALCQSWPSWHGSSLQHGSSQRGHAALGQPCLLPSRLLPRQQLGGCCICRR